MIDLIENQASATDVSATSWTDSSSEMETSTILEGFKNAEKVHGVRSMEFDACAFLVIVVYPSLVPRLHPLGTILFRQGAWSLISRDAPYLSTESRQVISARGHTSPACPRILLTPPNYDRN